LASTQTPNPADIQSSAAIYTDRITEFKDKDNTKQPAWPLLTSQTLLKSIQVASNYPILMAEFQVKNHAEMTCQGVPLPTPSNEALVELQTLPTFIQVPLSQLIMSLTNHVLWNLVDFHFTSVGPQKLGNILPIKPSHLSNNIL
jgi:hypothetical protein